VNEVKTCRAGRGKKSTLDVNIRVLGRIHGCYIVNVSITHHPLFPVHSMKGWESFFSTLSKEEMLHDESSLAKNAKNCIMCCHAVNQFHQSAWSNGGSHFPGCCIT
jgi:hypothetical protein